MSGKDYLCSLETFFSQGFVREKASFSMDEFGSYLRARIDGKYYVIRKSERWLSVEDIKRRYQPISNMVRLLGDDREILVTERDEEGYQYMIRTEDYLSLPQGAYRWKDRALKGHFLDMNSHFVFIRENRAELHLYDDFLLRDDVLEEGTRKYIYRDSPWFGVA